MPLDAIQAVLSSHRFAAMGVMNTVVVEDGAGLPDAMAIVEAEVTAIDKVCSRFRADSELTRFNAAAGQTTRISVLLEEALAAALHAAEITDGLVDPTVGKRVEEIGYNVTFGDLPRDGPPLELRMTKTLGWRAVELDTTHHTARIRDGVAVDLGAIGKAWAADRAADAVARKLGVGVLVELGGDVAVRGRVPPGGWPVRVAEESGAAAGEHVRIGDGGMATSGTTSRRWRRGGVELHDIIDPATGLPAMTPWAMVTVAAATCLEANAASTAALILGDGATRWLDGLGLPARLVRNDRSVQYTGGWTG